MSNKLIVVRHGERLDESDLSSWFAISRKLKECTPRNHYAIDNDPPLTDSGLEMAETCSRTVRGLLDKENINVQKVYASKLKRAYQTAYCIARRLNVPMYVSAGFALTAEAVRKAFCSDGQFEFLSVKEIQADCPGVVVIDLDTSLHKSHPALHNWLDAIINVISKEEHSIIVAHRETIRNLYKRYCHTPYCCLGTFNYDTESGEFDLVEVLNNDGTPVPSTSAL